jgi:hypothetical protein
LKNKNKSKKQIIGGIEFDLRYIATNKNKAKREAARYRKRGCFTRVIETCPGVFIVYSCQKQEF